MFSITVLIPAIEQLRNELVLLVDRAAKEPPRRDEATREIDMTMAEWIDVYGKTDFLKSD